MSGREYVFEFFDGLENEANTVVILLMLEDQQPRFHVFYNRNFSGLKRATTSHNMQAEETSAQLKKPFFLQQPIKLDQSRNRESWLLDFQQIYTPPTAPEVAEACNVPVL